MNNNYYQPPSLLMNEKELAIFLGQTEYAVKQLRLKCGLPTLPKNGRHEVQYYWPAVDEYLRQLSRPFNADDGEPMKKTEPVKVTDMNSIPTGEPEPATSKHVLYKPMEPV